jgi:mxaA protein
VRRFALAAVLAMCVLPARADEPVRSVTVVNPRDFGYFVGDVLTRRVDVTVSDPYRLDLGSLPPPGALNYWLDLHSVDVAEEALGGGRRYRVSLAYQTFYVPREARERTLPEVAIRFSGPDGNFVDAKVPAWTFVMSPLRQIQQEAPVDGAAGYLHPDVKPQFIDTARERDVAFWSGAAALISLTLLAYYYAWWPFHARSARPFTEASRRIRAGLRRGKGTSEAYRGALLALHRAFDRTAGRRLLADDVPQFVATHREFRPLADEIAAFFAASRRVFYGSDPEGAAAGMPLNDVVALGTRLGAAERGAA